MPSIGHSSRAYQIDGFTREQADERFFQDRRNYIIDGNFDFWYEGTSQTAGGYGSATMWLANHGGATKTFSRQAFALGQNEVPGNPKYFARTEVTEPASQASGDHCLLTQRVEGAATLSGHKATMSFWAKADAARSIAVEFEQHYGTGGSPSPASTAIAVFTINLTSTWAKYTVTVDLPPLTGKTLGTDGNDYLGVHFWFLSGTTYSSRTNSLGYQSGTFDIARVKLEEGDVATEEGWRSYAEELALCRRYYRKWEGNVGFAVEGNGDSTNHAVYLQIPLDTPMRVAPSVSWSAAYRFEAGNEAAVSASRNQADRIYLYGKSAGTGICDVNDLVADARL